MRHAAPLSVLLLIAACEAEEPDEGTVPEDTGPAWLDEAPVFAALGDEEAEVPTVAEVEVDRYLGTWYEIATFPIPFQASCARTSATYGVREEGGLTVFNQCRWGGLDGDPFSFTGKALPVDDTNAKLEVSFFGDNGAPYWVIERDDAEGDHPYRWALVSDPTMETLWILARHPQLTDTVLDPLLAVLEDRGYDTAALSWTEQPEEPYDPEASP